MKFNKSKRNNLIFLLVIVLLVIPQTRQPIQVFFHKGLALFSPSVTKESKRKVISDYNWELKNIDGNSYNLNSAKDKVVLINLWATWCPPCIAEMPSMQKLYDDYGDKVEFLFISNEKLPTLKKFLAKHNYNFNVYKPVSEYPSDFDYRSIPRTYVIDKNGVVVIDKGGAANWNSDKVRNQLDELIK